MKKITKMNETAWVLGIVFCSLGVALCTKASFGLSMIAAAPYVIHLKLINCFPWYSQGTSEYIWQGILLVIICLSVGKFKRKYLFSFASAVIFGLTVDMWLWVLGGNGVYGTMQVRIAAFVCGEALTALAISLYFRTYMPLQMYELLVVELAEKFGIDKNKMKLYNDAAMLFVSIVLALVLNKSFNGLGAGTVIITLVNAPLIGFFGRIEDRLFDFSPRFERLEKVLKICNIKRNNVKKIN